MVRTGDSTVVTMDLGTILTGSSKPLRTGPAGRLIERRVYKRGQMKGVTIGMERWE